MSTFLLNLYPIFRIILTLEAIFLQERTEYMKKLLAELFEKCLTKPYIHVENGASFYFEKEGGTLYIYFEPSNGKTDWRNNLDFFATPYCEMDPIWHCHGGFLKVWKSAKPHLEGAIKDKEIKSMIITGYSHGAALAVLCHEYAYYNRPDIRDEIKGFGFGCPRVLFRCAPREIKKRWENFFVIRNEGDIVTYLPPVIFGFCHVGSMVKIGKKGRYSPINAHKPENYLTELKNI